jgi:hypothetical protein
MLKNNINWNRNDEGELFIEHCKKVLPHKDIPIESSWTGYINTSTISTEKNFWTEDDMGRFVAVVNGTIIFQRMLNGYILLYADAHGNFTLATNEIIRKFYSAIVTL